MCQDASVISFSDWIRFLNGDTWQFAVYGRESEYPKLLKNNGDDVPPITLATGSLPMFALNRVGRVDIYSNTGSGEFRMYLDRELALSFTGGFSDSGAITGFDLYGGGFEANASFSEVCWRSDDTRKMIGVRSVWPFGDGVNMQWIGVKEDVNEIPVDETDANYTDTPGLVQEYTIPPLPVFTQNVVVSAIMVGARMATNPTNQAVVVRTNDADYLSPSFSTGGAIEDRMGIWETNPATSAQFTLDEVNDSEFNIGVAST